MFKFAVLALALVAVSNASILGAPFKPVIGSVMKDAVTKEKLQEVVDLSQVNGLKVKSVDSVIVQVVSGLKFRVEFTSEDDKKCNAVWVDAPWKNPKIRDIQVSCQ